MNLLIITQKVDRNDSALGFFHSWIIEFARHAESLTVICLEEGVHNLPDNVRVFSLGKNSQMSNVKCQMLQRIMYAARFMRHIIRFRNEYDVVFVHMNPEYVVLGGPLWRLLNKKIALWYVHRQVNLKLRVAEKFAHIIFSTTPEAFRLRSKKIHFLGHGIDFSIFSRKQNLSTSDVNRLEIVHMGRITPIKNLDVLIDAAAILKEKWGKKFQIMLVGAPSAGGDDEYEQKLKNKARELGLENEVLFVGKVSFARIAELYREADISVNLTPTGGMDKAVLESIASGTVALSANRAFKELFGIYAESLLFKERDAEDLAEKINKLFAKKEEERAVIQEYVYSRVKRDFDLEKLIGRITQLLYV